jgi:hypothetical protein
LAPAAAACAQAECPWHFFDRSRVDRRLASARDVGREFGEPFEFVGMRLGHGRRIVSDRPVDQLLTIALPAESGE